MTTGTETKSSLTAWERWELASFDPGQAAAAPAPVEAPPPPPAIPPEEIERIREEARREGREAGYAAGHAEGLAAGREAAMTSGRADAERITGLLSELDQRLAELDEVVAADLLALALEIARQVIRQAIAARPESILVVIREALAQLPLQHAAIHLHPEDASLVRSRAGDQISHAGHRIHEDPKLARGDVVIEAGGSHLDASLATRWRRVIESLGHDEPWLETPEP